uniref:Exportin5like protein putative n=1 Tax=Albugo laibachii Nc14 TaxID=890382 RepID=F0VZX8_9STRA|nr:exportin5like protein putative [Albugo laibachii Nc14]|eukprot:CCA14349.1 exportin5like protein putative [Albugo laibachii Nc14]
MLEIEEEVYQRLMIAIQVSHSNTASNNERKQAYEFCELFKGRPDSISYAFAIYKQSTAQCQSVTTSDVLFELHVRRHFSLHLVESYLLIHWKSITLDEQIQLRSSLLQLIFTSQSTQSEPVFVREKQVLLLVELAKRQFPQHWDSLLSDLFHFCQVPSEALGIQLSRIELILKCFRFLAEDCVRNCFSSSLPAARRKDILQGLNVCLPELVPLVYREVEMQYQRYKTRTELDQVEGVDVSQLERFIQAGLEMMKEFLEWIPVERAFVGECNWMWIELSLISEKPFRLLAMEGIQIYFSRTFGKENHMILNQMSAFVAEKLEQISFEITRELVQDTTRLDEELLFLRKINDAVVTWCNSQLDCFISSTGDEDTPTRQTEHIAVRTLCASINEQSILQRMLECSCRLFCHPSYVIAEAQSAVWLSMFKNTVLLEQPFMGPIVEKLRIASLEKYFRLGSPSRADPEQTLACCFGTIQNPSLHAPLLSSLMITSLCSAEEFDSDETFSAFFGNFRGRLFSIVRQLISVDPQVLLSMLLDRVVLIYRHFPASADNQNAQGFCTESSTAYLYHEGVSCLVDCVLKQLPTTVFDDKACQRVQQQLLQVVLIFKSNDPLLKYRQLLMVGSFARCYGHESGTSFLTPVFELLFEGIQFTLPEDVALHRLNSDAISVRRRALSSLVTICQTIPSQILPVLPVLCTKVQELFASDQVLDSEAVLLYEVLVLVSNSIEDAQARMQFLRDMITELLSEWTSPTMTDLVNSPESLASTVEASTSDAANKKILKKVTKTLTSVYGILKRATVCSGSISNPSSLQTRSESSTTNFDQINMKNNPFARSVWPILLPNLLTLTQSLHALRTPSIAQSLCNTTVARFLLYMSLDEVAQLLGGRNQLDDELIAPLPDTIRWSKWQKNVRDIVYHIIGLMFAHPTLYELAVENSNQSVQAILYYFASGVSCHLDVMEHRHLKISIAYVYIPFLRMCPAALYCSLLEPVLTNVLTHLSARLQRCFIEDVVANGYRTEAPWMSFIVGVDAAKAAVAHDKILMDLVRQVTELLERAIDPKVVVGAVPNQQKHVLRHQDSLLHDYTLYESKTLPGLFGQILIEIMCWKDTQSCRKAVGLADKMVTCLHERQEYHFLLGDSIFKAALKSLFLDNAAVKEDGLKWELINLIRNCYCRLVLGLNPVHECKGIDPAHQPTKPANELCLSPRGILASLPEIQSSDLDALDTFLREKHSIKTQKIAFKEILEAPMHIVRQNASSLTSTTRTKIDDLPVKLILFSKQNEATQRQVAQDRVDWNTSSLFGNDESG